MEENKKISIIMPCYNGEKYIEKAIKSVANSTSVNACELIIINDGSIDKTDIVVKTCIDKYRKISIKYIIIQKSGVSVARNTGLEIANGEYVLFLDADDEYSSTMIENLVKALNDQSSDYACCFWTNAKQEMYQKLYSSICVSRTTICDVLLYRTKPLGLWASIYRKSIIDTYKIRFDSTLKYGEDLKFLWTYILNCHSFCIVPQKMYFYRKNDDSTMKKMNPRKIEVLDAMEGVAAQIAILNPSYYKTFVKYMVPRTVLSLQKDFASADCKDMFDEIKNKYQGLSFGSLIRYGKKEIRIGAIVYWIAPNLFYNIIKYRGI